MAFQKIKVANPIVEMDGIRSIFSLFFFLFFFLLFFFLLKKRLNIKIYLSFGLDPIIFMLEFIPI